MLINVPSFGHLIHKNLHDGQLTERQINLIKMRTDRSTCLNSIIPVNRHSGDFLRHRARLYNLYAILSNDIAAFESNIIPYSLAF
jgi:hypothetical protein